MSISIILAHPNTDSFNYAIANTVKIYLQEKAYQVDFHDLYAENFPPMLPTEEIATTTSLPSIIEKHCQEIQTAEGIIIIHPNWWGQPPAILKGWIDRVLRAGVAYKFIGDDKGEGIPMGLLKARSALVFNTSNTLREREISVFGDPLETIWKNCIFGLCGVNNFYRRTFNVIITSSLEQRQEWLREVKEAVGRYFP